jgi:ATP-binding cassette subfamily C protein LapB
MSHESPFRSCLFPLLDALGWKGDREAISEYLSGAEAPADLAEFRNVMAALRFGSATGRRKLDAIADADLPCLALVGGQPACLIAREGPTILSYLGAEGVYRAIPARGSGTVVAFRPMGEGLDSILSSRPDWLWILYGRFKAQLGSALSISVVLGALSLLYPVLIAMIFSQMGIDGSSRTIWKLGLGVAAFLAADSGFRSFRSAILGYTSLRSGKILGDELFRRLLSFQASYTEAASAEAQVRRIKDLGTVADFVGGSALAALFDLPFVAVMIVWLVSVGGSVALVPALGLAAFLATSLVAYPAMKRVQAAASARKAERMDTIASIVAGSEDIAAACMRKAWMGRFTVASAKAAEAGYDEAAGSSLISVISGFFVSAGGLATLYAGVDAVLDKRMATSALVASMLLVWRVLGVARSTFTILSQVDALGSSLRQLQRFMALPQETGTGAFTVPAHPPEGDLEFQDVSFRYGPEGYPALYAASFKAERGKVTLVSGRQGAGKTTALKLALGLYRPQVGRVMIGPFNIRQSDPIQLRRAIAYAPETPMLLRGRLLDFVRGSTGASMARIEGLATGIGLVDALAELGLNLDGEVPEGFEELHPDAARLASILRALVKDSPIYLFDEQSFFRPEAYRPRFERVLRNLAESGAVVVAVDEEGGAGWADASVVLDGGYVVRGGVRR